MIIFINLYPLFSKRLHRSLPRLAKQFQRRTGFKIMVICMYIAKGQEQKTSYGELQTWWRSGAVIRASDFGSRGPWFEPRLVHISLWP